MPLALQNATRALKPLIDSDKEYVCLMKLHADVKEDKIRETLLKFQGDIYQKPPLRSSVKRVRRIRKIYKIEPLEIDGRNVLFKARVDPGTYMRKLCVDLGYALGVEAHMEELRRTKSGVFDEKNSVDLYDVYAAVLDLKGGNEATIRKIVRPIEEALAPFSKVVITDASVDRVCRGMALRGDQILAAEKNITAGAEVVLITKRKEAVALGVAKADCKDLPLSENPFNISRVIMDAGMYPRLTGSPTP